MNNYKFACIEKGYSQQALAAAAAIIGKGGYGQLRDAWREFSCMYVRMYTYELVLGVRECVHAGNMHIHIHMHLSV